MLCGVMTKLKHVQKPADDLAIPTKYAFRTLRHGTCVALQTQRMETDMLCGVMSNDQAEARVKIIR